MFSRYVISVDYMTPVAKEKVYLTMSIEDWRYTNGGIVQERGGPRYRPRPVLSLDTILV